MRAVAIGLLLCFGCSSDDGNHDDDVVDCEKELRKDNFVIGFDKTGVAGKLDFQLMATDPSPQFAGDNEWTLLISTMSAGQVVGPLSGATLSVSPFMPDHGHPAPKPVVITPLATPGQYKLSEINTWMPGLWETTVQVTGADGDKVVFKTCVPS